SSRGGDRADGGKSCPGGSERGGGQDKRGERGSFRKSRADGRNGSDQCRRQAGRRGGGIDEAGDICGGGSRDTRPERRRCGNPGGGGSRSGKRIGAVDGSDD